MTDCDSINFKLLIEMLKLNPEQKLIVLFDAFGYEIAHYLSEAAAECDIPFCARFVPMPAQLQHSKRGTIPNCLCNCLRETTALVFAVSDHEDNTRFRATVLKAARESQTKILHLPGVDLDLIKGTLTGLDLSALQKNATQIKNILDKATTVDIYTADKRNPQTSHKLSLSLKDRKAYRDMGAVAPGEIAQLPTGEVYIAPNEYIAEGTLVVNGSAPETVFRNNAVVVLQFARGVVDIGKSFFANTIECCGFQQELIQFGSQDKKNLALGEFGIGLNKSIVRFTGKPIHDEKAAGTAHVALGSNIPFGGVIDSDCHIDLIFIPERVVVDGTDLSCRWGLGSL